MVFGKLNVPQKHGTLAEFVVIAQNDGIVKVPDAFLAQRNSIPKLEDMACIGTAGQTAWQSLKNVRPGAHVFINGGTGGTGTFGIQIAKHVLGCEKVVISCSKANASLAKDLGADETIDYQHNNLVVVLERLVQPSGQKFDYVVDNVGNDLSLYWSAHRYLKESGTYALIGVPALSFYFAMNLAKIYLWPAVFYGGKRRFQMIIVKTSNEDLENIANWMVDGKVKAVIENTYPLEQIPTAYDTLRSGKVRGKIAVIFDM
jgi:NADPH:quinone reductase-like Zn-dependent oxidoreductase